MTEKTRYATIRNPNIIAIIEERFRFNTPEQAWRRINSIANKFIVAKEQPEHDDGLPILRLWIKGYLVTEDEAEKGAIGNFAIIAARKLEDESASAYTLSIAKDSAPVKYHPQRKRAKRRHPDWGHPILRRIAKEHKFDTIEDARAALETLHKEYPEVTIPLDNKIYIIIYTRHKKPPIRKYVLEIKILPEGGFYIEHYENYYQKKEIPKLDNDSAEQQDNENITYDSQGNKVPQGYFSSLVSLKKKKPPK